MNDELLGYCLNALDDDTRRRVDDYLDANPDAKVRLSRLEAALKPLDLDRKDADPPTDLVNRTLALIAESKCQTLPFAPRVSPTQPMRRGWWRRPDVLAAAVLLFTTAGLLIPWIVQSRQKAEVAECQVHLKKFGQALVTYADQNNGHFPKIAEDAPFNFAGSFLAMLLDKNLVDPLSVVGCPGFGKRDINPLNGKQVGDLHRDRRADYERAVHELGGAFAYNLGYRNNGLHGLTTRDDGNIALMADRPPFGGHEEVLLDNSRNHGGRGQNVLYLNGGVRFEPTRLKGDDDMFLNREKRVGAGIDRGDTVLGASDAVP